jgi:peptide methionine sulfoxide reductase MsrA
LIIQGPDVGSQYLPAIFFHFRPQQEAALASLDWQQRSGRYRRPLVTRIFPATHFWKAEAEHQKYFLR